MWVNHPDCVFFRVLAMRTNTDYLQDQQIMGLFGFIEAM